MKKDLQTITNSNNEVFGVSEDVKVKPLRSRPYYARITHIQEGYVQLDDSSIVSIGLIEKI